MPLPLRFLSADWIFPVSDAPQRDIAVLINTDGIVVDVVSLSAVPEERVEKHEGIICPGFVNAHCHVELSHMLEVAPTGIGLTNFIGHVIRHRNAPLATIVAAIEAADKAMYEQGIVAVGDISNTTDSFPTKAKSSIRYYSFVEFFDLYNPALTEEMFQRYLAVYQNTEDHNQHNLKSCVPHAPYSVSEQLFGRLKELHASSPTQSVSIHNQETAAETQLFLEAQGELAELFRSFGVPIDDHFPKLNTSIAYALYHLTPQHRTLLVHNTMTTAEDIAIAHAWGGDRVFWVTCPNANLYIENRLPRYADFIAADACVAIGTDSLTSNWTLCILEEMKTIQRYQSFIPLATLMQWATLNGARALGFEEALGSLTIGKQPGLNLIQGADLHQLRLRPDSRVMKLA